MTARVLIIGGYGNFGGFIAKRLAADKDIQVIIAGRSPEKAKAFASSIEAVNPIESGALDTSRPDSGHLLSKACRKA